MGKKMKYRIKNEQLAKLVYSIFEEEDVQRKIAEQIADSYDMVEFTSDKKSDIATKLCPEYDYLKNAKSEVEISIDKNEIERIREYNPNRWNPYPETTPPEQKRYLVFMDYEGSHNILILYWVDWKSWENEHVIAFRELPEPYDPEEQE